MHFKIFIKETDSSCGISTQKPPKFIVYNVHDKQLLKKQIVSLGL